MRNPISTILLLLTCSLWACQPATRPDDPVTPPDDTTVTPVDTTVIPPVEDGLQHDSLTVIYDLFCNPERGFHIFKEFHSPNPEMMYAQGVKNIYDMGYSLILTNYYIENYRDTLIADSYLDVVRNNLQAIREGGCKCVLRFAYTSSDAQSQKPYDAPEDLVLQHIQQIKPILQEYADVIFVMEAGFVGVWGEWYYTTNFKYRPTTDEDFVGRRHVLDALLEALPQERMICVRTPEFKMRCYGWGLADTLTIAEAYSGTPKARLAAHDDAFMANESDMGTFNGSYQRRYWEADTRYTIYGGESCQPGKYANAENSIAQMKAMHISYLNISYHKTVISGWQKEGRLDEMRRRIGYRLYASDVATTKEPKMGEDLRVVVTIENEGFSSPKNPRDIKMLLVNKDTKEELTVVPDCDPRFWFPEQKNKIDVTFKPAKPGNYDLYLYLPDPQPTLANNPKYAIRLANKDCWDETTGYNYLTTITVN